MDELSGAILALDMGNTTARFGLFAGDESEPRGTWELTAPEHLTVDEARLMVAQGICGCLGQGMAPMALVAAAPLPVRAILSCVVPSLAAPLEAALARMCAARPRVVGPGLKTGLKMRYDDPAEVGPDRIADAVAARAAYGAPAIVVDLGTTTNIEVVDAAGDFAGGIIAPGLDLGARSLSAAAARLPEFDLAEPVRVIGKSTREAMRSGVVLGEAARIDGLLAMIEAELAEGARGKRGSATNRGTKACAAATNGPAARAAEANSSAAPNNGTHGTEVVGSDPADRAKAPAIVVTGDHATEVAALLTHKAAVDETLTLRGLAQLHRLNEPGPRKRC